MTVTPHKIVLKSPNGRYDEFVAAGAFYPGHLLKINSDGEVIKSTVSGEAAERIFAIEDALQGNTIDDAYAADDVARVWHALPGDEIYAWLQDEQNVVVGAQLMSGGDGTLVPLDNTGTADFVNAPIAVALEAVDTTTGTAVASGRIKVRIL